MAETPAVYSSLEGIEFVSLKVNDTFGRQIVTHHYPNSDRTDHEDAGGLPASYQVEGVVFGAGWMERLRRLRALSELKQPGELTYIHPYWGSRTGVLQSLAVLTDQDRTDFAKIRFTFIEGQLAQLAFEETLSTQGVATELGVLLNDLSAAAAGLELS